MQMTVFDIKDFRSKYTLFLAMIFGYMAFILYQATILPIWHDEAITLLDIAGNPTPNWPAGLHRVSDFLVFFSGTGEIKDIPDVLIRTDVHPPVYYFVANVWSQIFGNDIFSVRVLSALMAGGTMFLVWRTFFQQGDENKEVSYGAFTALLLMIISPTFSYVALNARGYSVAMFLVASVIFLAHLLINKTEENPKQVFALLTGAGVLSALAFLTNYMTIFVVGPVLLFLALRNIRQHAVLVVISAVITIGIASFSLPFLAEQMGARPGQYAGFTDIGVEVLSVFIGLLRQICEPAGTDNISHISAFCGFFVFVFILLGGVFSRKNLLVWMHVFVITCYAAGIFVLFWKSDKTLINGATSRYLVFIVPSFAIMIGQVINFLPMQKLMAGTLNVFLVMCFLNTWVFQEGPTHQPWTIKPSLDWVQSALGANDPDENMIIFATKARGIVSVPILAVDSETEVGIIRSEDDASEIFNAAQTKDTILYIADSNNEGILRIADKLIIDLKSIGFRSDNGAIWTRD
jgi:uncharacterized membrane protein